MQQAVKEKLEELNHIPFKKRKGNRHSAYIEEERDFMKQLPLTPYEPAVWSTARVPLDYLISDGKNKYSVPYDLIGKDVDIRLTRRIVEVFFGGSQRSEETQAKKVGSRVMGMFPELRAYTSFASPHWRCRVGDFTNHEDAVAYMHKIKSRGISEAMVVKSEIYVTADQLK